MTSLNKVESGAKIPIAPVEDRRKPAANAIIEQWAATWTTFLQRDAYPEREERAVSEPPEPAAS